MGLDNMSPSERIAYSHGRIQADLKTFRLAILDMQNTLRTSSRLWMSLLVIGAAMLLAVAIFLGQLTTLFDVIYVMTVITTFVAFRFFTLHIINDMMKVSNMLMDIMSAISNDATLQVAFEDMQREGMGLASLVTNGEGVRDA